MSLTFSTQVLPSSLEPDPVNAQRFMMLEFSVGEWGEKKGSRRLKKAMCIRGTFHSRERIDKLDMTDVHRQRSISTHTLGSQDVYENHCIEFTNHHDE